MLAAEEAPRPPPQVFTASAAADAASGLIDPGRPAPGRQSATGVELGFLERTELGHSPWYYGWGFQTQQAFFSGAFALGVTRLQEITGQLSLQYFLAGEPVASVSVKPGVFGDSHLSSSGWDLPVQAYSGIPLTDQLAGVVGASDGRLYHHPLPIVGLVWTVSPGLRIEAVYPEPALVARLSPRLEFRLGGELAGDGYWVRAGAIRTRLEYYSYRVLAALTYRFAPGAKLSAGVGAEIERVFDFYEIGRRLHARPAASFELGLEWAL